VCDTPDNLLSVPEAVSIKTRVFRRGQPADPAVDEAQQHTASLFDVCCCVLLTACSLTVAQKRDWLALVAVHSDCWLLAVAFYNGARLNKEGR
jgi:Alfin